MSPEGKRNKSSFHSFASFSHKQNSGLAKKNIVTTAVLGSSGINRKELKKKKSETKIIKSIIAKGSKITSHRVSTLNEIPNHEGNH